MQTTYYTRDHLGSVREMTDSSGVVQARYDYDPYGRVTKLSGTVDSDFLFTGLYYHAPSGLHLAMYRAYDADTGRWLNRDPIGENGGLNLYGYVGNNTINGADPSGLTNQPGDFGWGWYTSPLPSGFSTAQSASPPLLGPANGNSVPYREPEQRGWGTYNGLVIGTDWGPSPYAERFAEFNASLYSIPMGLPSCKSVDAALTVQQMLDAESAALDAVAAARSALIDARINFQIAQAQLKIAERVGSDLAQVSASDQSLAAALEVERMVAALERAIVLRQRATAAAAAAAAR